MTAQVVEPARLGRPRDGEAELRILKSTLTLLGEHGYTALTIEAVAARAAVAKTTVYRRWPSKFELSLDALTALREPVPRPPGESVRDDVLYVLESVRRTWDSAHGRLMIRLAAGGLDEEPLYSACRERVVVPRRAVLARVLARGVDTGELPADLDLDWAIDLLVGPIVASGMTHRAPVRSGQLEFMVDTIIAGLRSRL
jgi:AcrR family transcriptional regulator